MNPVFNDTVYHTYHTLVDIIPRLTLTLNKYYILNPVTVL